MTYELDEDRWDEQALPLDWCIAPGQDTLQICRAETTVVDSIGLPWCKAHAFRGEFLEWGKAHGWPALELWPYKVAAGMFHWVVVATLGLEDMVWLLLGAIEMEGHTV